MLHNLLYVIKQENGELANAHYTKNMLPKDSQRLKLNRDSDPKR
jgi:hypothetical protein